MRLIPTIIIMVLFTGCGAKDDDSSSTPSLVGTWVLDCHKNDDGTSFGATIEFTNTTHSDVITVYTDGSCASAALKATIEGTYVIGELSTVVEGTRNLEQVFTKNERTALTDAEVKILTDAVFCGKTDWVLNTAASVKGSTCVADGNYDIFKIEESKLTFGKNTSENNGKSAAKRPITLDSYSFSRKPL